MVGYQTKKYLLNISQICWVDALCSELPRSSEHGRRINICCIGNEHDLQRLVRRRTPACRTYLPYDLVLIIPIYHLPSYADSYAHFGTIQHLKKTRERFSSPLIVIARYP
jgi:hypothetical protein